MPKIGIFLPNWIGDVVMATPTLRALSRRFRGEAELIGILRPYVAEVLAGTSWLDRQIVHDPKQGALGLARLGHELWSAGLDAVVLLTNSLSTAALAWLSGATQRLGYNRELRSFLLTESLEPPREAGRYAPISPVDYYLQLAYALGCPPEAKRLELATLPADEAAADRAWELHRLPEDGRVVVFNGGGGWGGTATAKAWPVEHFAALAQRITADSDWHVLVNCGPNERDIAAEIVRRADHPRVVSLAPFTPEELTLGMTKACLKRSGLVVSTDSGPRHIATAFDRPVIGLFGPIDPRWSETYHPQAVSLRHPVPCSPCFQKVCPLGHHACMRDLTVDRVYAAVAAQLGLAAPARQVA